MFQAIRLPKILQNENDLQRVVLISGIIESVQINGPYIYFAELFLF